MRVNVVEIRNETHFLRMFDTLETWFGRVLNHVILTLWLRVSYFIFILQLILIAAIDINGTRQLGYCIG